MFVYSSSVYNCLLDQFLIQMRDIQRVAGNPRRDGTDLPPNLHSVNARRALRSSASHVFLVN